MGKYRVSRQGLFTSGHHGNIYGGSSMCESGEYGIWSGREKTDMWTVRSTRGHLTKLDKLR